MSQPFSIRRADWATEQRLMRATRFEVFIREQAVPEHIELDGLDAACLHVLALDADEKPIGTARMQPDGHIGRVAVLRAWRNKGVGRAMVRELIEAATSLGLRSVELHSQLHAAEFYERLGFERTGAIFQEAGIPHVRMVRAL